MIKKIFAKLVNWSGQRENFSASRFRANQEDEARMARERQKQIMDSRDKKYVSEQTVPSEDKILGPSDSGLKEESE